MCTNITTKNSKIIFFKHTTYIKKLFIKCTWVFLRAHAVYSGILFNRVSQHHLRECLRFPLHCLRFVNDPVDNSVDLMWKIRKIKETETFSKASPIFVEYGEIYFVNNQSRYFFAQNVCGKGFLLTTTSNKGFYNWLEA